MESMSYIYLAMTDSEDQPTLGYDSTPINPESLPPLPVIQLPQAPTTIAEDCDRQNPIYPTLYF